MKNLFLIIVFLTAFKTIKTFYYSKNGRTGSYIPKLFEIELTDKNSYEFPNRFNLNFQANNEKFKINFIIDSKKYPDIYVLDKQGNPIKYGLKNPEDYEHYVDSTGEAHATLIKNKINSTDQFRLIAKINSKNELNTTYEVFPVIVSKRRKRNANKNDEFYHAFEKRNSNQESIAHAFLNTLDAKDYIVEKSEHFTTSKPKRKQAKVVDGALIFNVETLIVTDSSVFEDHKRISNSNDQDLVFSQMRIYFSHLMHSVDQKYQNSLKNDPQMKINTLLTSLLFFTDPKETSWADPTVVGDPQYPSYDGIEVVVASPALKTFKDYLESKTFSFTYDHAMALLRKDLWSESNENPESRKTLAGLAYLNGICTTNRYSISEEFSGFSSIFIIAHELGHNLGSVHDGDPKAEACPLTDYFIMTPVLSFEKIQNMQKFSTCSISQFKSLLISEGSTTDYSQCLTNIPQELPQEFINANFSLTGQLFDPNKQCRMRNGNSASFCHFLSDKICSELYCRRSNDERTCYASSPAVEGTICESGKMCISGICTSSQLVSDSVCPFGDDLVQNGTEGIILSSLYVSCQEFISTLINKGKSEASFCSSDRGQSDCCSTCLKYKYLDCKDKFSNCGDFKDNCPTGNFNSGPVKDECCATCQTRPITCSSSPALCLNGGKCSDTITMTNLLGYKCECLNGFSGYNCETATSQSTTTESSSKPSSSTRISSTSQSTTTESSSKPSSSTRISSTSFQSSSTFSSLSSSTSFKTDITTSSPSFNLIDQIFSIIISTFFSFLRNLFLTIF